MVKVLKETRMTAVFISCVLRMMVILYSDVKKGMMLNSCHASERMSQFKYLDIRLL